MNAHHHRFAFASALVLGLGLGACADDGDGNGNDGQDPVGHESVRSELARDTSPSVPEADMETLIAGNHRFAIDLYQELDTTTDNLMLSPLSIRMAFGLLQAGAAGATEAEIAEVLHYGLDQSALHPAFNALDLALAERNDPGDDDFDPVQLRVANAFWGQTGYPWKASYLDTIALNYGAGVETLDYDLDPEGSRETINTWVEDRTEDRIKDLLPEGSISADTVAVLTNALYFTAPWALPFQPEGTRDGDFTTLGGDTVTGEFMHQGDVFGYAAAEGVQALEMNFHLDELSMVFLLPDAGEFEAFEDALTVEGVEALIGDIAPTQGTVAIPKFEFESGFLLSQALQALGMTTAFGSADLSGMIDNGDLFIDEVYHKTFIAIDEVGAEAAAATAIVVGETSIPIDEFDFVADRPFIVIIRDRITGAWLFFGRVAEV